MPYNDSKPKPPSTVDPDKFKAFKRGLLGQKPEDEDEEEQEKPSMLSAMKRKLLGG